MELGFPQQESCLKAMESGRKMKVFRDNISLVETVSQRSLNKLSMIRSTHAQLGLKGDMMESSLKANVITWTRCQAKVEYL